MDIRSIGRTIERAFQRNKPAILTGVGIGGMIVGTYFAVDGTLKAKNRIEEEKVSTGQKKLTAKQTVKVAWKYYIPAVVIDTASIGCLIGANRAGERRNAAMATALSLSETAVKEYRDRIPEIVGEEKAQEIEEAVDRKKVEHDAPRYVDEPLVIEGFGKTLCYDSLSGRYFYSDRESLERVVNDLNRRMATMSEPYITLNDFYMANGLSDIDIGNDLGWNVDKGLIELRFTSQLAQGRTPCLVVSHYIPPMYDFY